MTKRLIGTSLNGTPMFETLPNEFGYPYKTTIPSEIVKEWERWEDRSWHNDASACGWTKVPTTAHPKAVLCLWVQADKKDEREFPEMGTFQLDWIADSDEGWDEDTCRTLLTSDSIEEVMKTIKKMRG